MLKHFQFLLLLFSVVPNTSSNSTGSNDELAETTTHLVFNPANDPNRQHRWSHFLYPKYDRLKNNPKTYYAMFVYQSPEKELYFFSYNVAFALGYEWPHEAVANYVPPEDQKRINFASGIFLNKEGVYNFINKTHGKDEVFFKNWFEDYLIKCENNTIIDVYSTCPI
ncbi:hypothetical protein TNIN_179441 [Trichonephila inaurata madagascariensis]|uniref:Bro-N domain-containing protein n=1 Tax=Trichonephila inaurata madagascariensis TaxID=2747483 RepID=A0A8X6Y9Q1_9ARAC|nr:hypothetical protein TNIN_179441 [Trichonephila inaurata madagascariensis]